MEEVTEGFFKLIFRLLRWIIIDAITDFVLYWYGRGFLKTLTFGQYPRKHDVAETRCTMAGLIAMIVTVAVIFSLISG